MKIPRSYETVTEAVNDLRKRGYTIDFMDLTDRECLICHQPVPLELSPDEFEIDEIYRFEGLTDPGDEMIVFAISSSKYEIRGIVVNAFGTYSDTIAQKITGRLQINPE